MDNLGFDGDWPDKPAAPRKLRPLLPNRPWPKIAAAILVPDNASPLALERTRRSVLNQDHPDVELIEAFYNPSDHTSEAKALMRSWEQSDADYLLALRPAEMLAPGALASACVWLELHPAEVLAGLRVFYDDQGPYCVDVLAQFGEAEPKALELYWDVKGFPAMRAGELLFSRAAVRPLDVMGPADNPVANLLTALAGRQARVSVLARPFLLVERKRGQEAASAVGGLRIAALNDVGLEVGGASIAHRRLVQALQMAGHHVDFFKLSDDAAPVAAEWTQNFPKTEQAIAAGKYHLVLVGNIHGVTRDANVLARIHAHTPVAVVTHDLFMLSGRCGVALNCPAIERKCGALCPNPDAYPALAPKRIEAAWESKRRFLSARPQPLLLANSQWTAALSRKVLGTASSGATHQIALGFPCQAFRPQDRKLLRLKLGLPADDVLILCSAVVVNNPYKGGADLLAVLKNVAREGVGFVVLGRIDQPKSFELPNIFAPGLIADEERLADYYAACDLHVTASRHESLGQTPIEAGLCGAPSAAYRCEGLETAVLDGVSGLLADPGAHAPEGRDLKTIVKRLVEDAELRRSLGVAGSLALEARNNYAASYLSLHAALVAQGVTPASGRVGFSPQILRAFSSAQNPLPGVVGPANRKPKFWMLWARRIKIALWGDGVPFYVRRTLYAIHQTRGFFRRR